MEIEHLSGIEGIKALFEQALQNKEKQLRTLLHDRPLVYLAGEAFASEYMTARVEAGIHLQSLRISAAKLDLPGHEDYAKYHKEARIAPKDVKIDESLVIWDDNVAIVDTKNISCVIIKNAKNAKIVKQFFDQLWARSE